MDRPLADKYYNLARQAKMLQSDLEDCIIRAIGKDPHDPDTWGFDDFIFDDYDRSFELRGCTEPMIVLTDEHKAALRALGFERCWVCRKPADEYDPGVYYYLKGGTRESLPKRRSCPMCKPQKMGAEPCFKPKELEKLARMEKEARDR